MRILPVSLDAVLVELSGLDETLALLEALQADPVEGVVDLVPAARTLLVQFQPWVCTQAALVAQIRSRQGRPVHGSRRGSWCRFRCAMTARICRRWPRT